MTLKRFFSRQIVLAFALVALPNASMPVALAWWDSGHKHITVGAVDHLPQPLRGFFEQNLAQVRDRSGMEPPGSHWIHLDSYPEFYTGTLSHDIDELIDLHGSSHVNGNGTAPWTVASYVEQLTAGMMAAESPADWVALIPIAAAQAHYVEDLHNPLHLTFNYNGQATGNTGIHARYEGEMVVRHLNELTFTPTPVEYLPSVIDYVFEGAEEHYYYLVDILDADDISPKTGATPYYNSMWAETGEFTQVLFQKASEAVANTWYTAWVNAGSPRTFLEFSADFNADGQVDGADLIEWQNAYATDKGGDADGDGDSDGRDFLVWQGQYGGGVEFASGIAVPEPSASVAAAILALVTIGTGERRRFVESRIA